MVSLEKLKIQCQRHELYNPPNAEVKSPKKIIEVISQHKYIEGLCLSATTNFPNEKKKAVCGSQKVLKNTRNQLPKCVKPT